jgi:hypothetical protein
MMSLEKERRLDDVPGEGGTRLDDVHDVRGEGETIG